MTRNAPLFLLCLSYFVVIMLLFTHLATPFLFFLLALIGLNGLKGLKTSFTPSTLNGNVLAVLSLVVLFITISIKDTVQIFVAMLLLASLLKLLIARTKKHYNTIIVLGFFTFSLVFLYSQSLLTTLLISSLYALLLITLAIHNNQLTLKHSAKVACFNLLATLPLAVLMLIFIPKLPAFWQMPNAGLAKTGLNENIDPFSIMNLSKSKELVFRAELNASPSNLPQAPYYWRAIVHDKFNGKAWALSPLMDAPLVLKKPQQIASAQSVRIISEPSNTRWLYNLANYSSPNKQVINLANGLIKKRKFTHSSAAYSLNKRETTTPHTLTAQQTRHYTQLPQAHNRQARILAKRLAQTAHTPKAFLAQLARFYQQNGFVYTLTPNALHGDSTLDEFLFASRQGFCGHYASSSAFLLRAAGFPARVVSGYLGGELLNQGQNQSKSQETNSYLAVYQYDAHAWVEFWQNGAWHRFDATEFIAPERLNGSLSQMQTLQQAFMENLDAGLLQLSHIQAFNWLRLKLEEIDYNWTKWVLGFNSESQKGLLQRLLGSSLARFSGAVMLGILVLALGVVFLFLALNKPKDTRPIFAKQLEYLLQAARKKMGLTFDNTTPLHAFSAIKKAQPNLTKEIDEISQQYQSVRYQQKPSTKTAEQAFTRLIKQTITKMENK